MLMKPHAPTKCAIFDFDSTLVSIETLDFLIGKTAKENQQEVEKITNMSEMSEDEMFKKMKKKSVPFESSPKTDNVCYGKQKETREEVIYG